MKIPVLDFGDLELIVLAFQDSFFPPFLRAFSFIFMMDTLSFSFYFRRSVVVVLLLKFSFDTLVYALRTSSVIVRSHAALLRFELIRVLLLLHVLGGQSFLSSSRCHDEGDHHTLSTFDLVCLGSLP